MLKKIFKAAKDIIKSPIGQIGIAAFAPMLAPKFAAGSFLNTALRSPALIQGGIGLLSGDKPQNVLRNLATGALMSGIGAYPGAQGQTFSDRMGSYFQRPQTIAASATGNNAFKAPQIVDDTPIGVNMDPGGVNVDLTPTNVSSPAASQGILRDMGLIVDTVTDEISGKPRPANFFEKYGNIVKLGTAGASIAAAALGAEDAAKLYDPEKNPYLKSGTGSKDFYEGINPIYSAKGGGISDFPRKTGMIDGPGDGQSDDIPAMLSDGEFVMTKQAVMAAGNGDRDKGTKQMYAMMNGLEDKAKEMGIGKF